MNVKKFVYIFLSVLFLFLSYNIIVWNFYTEKLLTGNINSVSGDLARMGYISELAVTKKTENSLPKRHINAKYYDGSKVDMITIGDSFSNGGGGGKNAHYQDHIATISNLKILNLPNYQEKTRSYIETAYILLNSGFLEQSGVKYILIESVERKIVQRFLTNVDSSFTDSIENIYKFYKFTFEIPKVKKSSNKIDKTNVNYVPETPFINNGNIKFVLYNTLYNFSDNAFISQVYRTKITKDLFSKGQKDLLFYKNDLSRIYMNTEENVKIVNKNLNDLAQALSKKGIKLIFIPAVNKYDLYSSFIENNPYPKDFFFDNLRKFDKKYIFIDTKKILLERLIAGDKDIYHVDDTHWSNKAAELVSLQISKYIKASN